MMIRLLGLIHILGLPILALGDSGMPRVWVYENSQGTYMIQRSKSAELEERAGQSTIKSRLHIFREIGGSYPSRPEIVTRTTCTFVFQPQNYISCSASQGPFSGARFDVFDEESIDRNLKRLAKRYVSRFSKAGEKIAGYGIYGHSVYLCTHGCGGIETPRMIVEILLMGD